MEEREEFVIKGKSFQFRMSDCYKQETGICPIEVRDKEINCRCNEIRQELEETNFKFYSEFPTVTYNSGCNHYICNDAQHRTCIMGKLGKNVEIQSYQEARGQKCAVCNNIYNFTDCVEFIEDF